MDGPKKKKITQRSFAVRDPFCPFFCVYYVIFGPGSSISGSLPSLECLHVLFELTGPPHIAYSGILNLKFAVMYNPARPLLSKHSCLFSCSVNSRYTPFLFFFSFCFLLISGYCPFAPPLFSPFFFFFFFKRRPLTSSWMLNVSVVGTQRSLPLSVSLSVS